MMLELPRDEFEILRQDDLVIHLYDKKVDKVYVLTKATETTEAKWEFPQGSRVEIIAMLTGVEL